MGEDEDDEDDEDDEGNDSIASSWSAHGKKKSKTGTNITDDSLDTFGFSTGTFGGGVMDGDGDGDGDGGITGMMDAVSASVLLPGIARLLEDANKSFTTARSAVRHRF